MPSCVCQSMESQAMSGRSWQSGVSNITYIRTISAGWFKCRVSMTSSRRTSFWNHSRRSSTTFSCRCSKPPIIRASIRSCTNFFNTSLVSIRSTMRASRRIRFSIPTCHFPKTGQLTKTRRTLIISSTCTRISLSSTTSVVSEAWTLLCWDRIAARLELFNILSVDTWWQRISLTDCYSERFPFFNISST